jgi:hypothetical protein
MFSFEEADAGGIFGQGTFFQWFFFIVYNPAHGMFGRYAMFSFGVSLDPRGCRGTWKKGYPAFEVLAPGRLSRGAAALGEGFAEKQEVEVMPQVRLWMLS